jgi:hypothetical protein
MSASAVKAHGGSMMRKMKAGALAALANMAARLRPAPASRSGMFSANLPK